MARVQQYWSQQQWLAARNRYRRDCIDQIERDAPDKATWTPVHKHLSDYIAASSILHCFDGWSYLGRGLDAELAGDPDSARHLGYYAELRAAMALLAGEGIGVFKSKHVVTDSGSRCHCLRGGRTHEFAWEALEHWAASPAGVSTIQTVIRPGGLSLQEWLTHYPGGTSFVATNWLTQWGLDLARFADDRAARNISSYRPTAFTSPGPTPVIDTIDAVCRFWEIWEPGSLGGFPVLDRHLLRLGIEMTFRNAHAYRKTRLQAKRKYESDVQAMLWNVSPRELSQAQWETFLTYSDQPAIPQLFADAAATDGPDQARHSKQVLARAALLLRVATGSVDDLLTDITDPREDLRFWWSDGSVRRKLWLAGSEPTSFSDLWQDAKVAIDTIRSWLAGAAGQLCHYRLWNEQSAAASSLASAERVALWGLRL